MRSLHLFCLSLFLIHPLHALTLPLTAVPARVAEKNPRLAAARLRIEEARGRLLGAGRLANPEAGVELKHDPRFREGAAGLSLDQAFPLTNRLHLEKELSRRELEAAELEVREVRRQMVTEARETALRLKALDDQQALRARQAELAKQLAESVAGFATRGEVSSLDATQARVDALRMSLESRQIETERAALQGKLKPLLGLAPGDTITISGALPEIGSSPRAGDWTRRADFQLAKKQEETAAAGVALSRARRWDDARAGFFLEDERMEDAPDGLDHTPFLGLRFSLPLPLWNKNEGQIAEKTAAARRAELETKALASQITNEAAAARAEMEQIAKLAKDTTEKLLPLVIEQAEKLEAAYQRGQTDLITVLRIREQRLQVETTVLDARRDWHLARIRYEAATGREED